MIERITAEIKLKIDLNAELNQLNHDSTFRA